MTSSMVRLWVCIKNSMMEGSTARNGFPWAHRQGGEAHGRLDGLAAVDGADGGAVAQMTGDDLQLFNGTAQHIAARRETYR